MGGPLTIGIGEILWDVFPEGAKFGGAPANFASHASALGADSAMFSAVGADHLGEQALAELEKRSVNCAAVARSPRPTGTVNVRVDAGGVPSYEFAADTAWDRLEFTPTAADLAAKADIVAFGTLGQRSPDSRRAIGEFIEATSPDAWRVFDVNLRQDFHSPEIIVESIRRANVLKLNDEELPAVMAAIGRSAEDPPATLLGAFNLRAVALTRGDAGAELHLADECHRAPALEVDVADTVGAGDAFTAALVVGLFHELPPAYVLNAAVRIAAFVCSRPGATPELPVELRNLVQRGASPSTAL